MSFPILPKHLGSWHNPQNIDSVTLGIGYRLVATSELRTSDLEHFDSGLYDWKKVTPSFQTKLSTLSTYRVPTDTPFPDGSKLINGEWCPLGWHSSPKFEIGEHVEYHGLVSIIKGYAPHKSGVYQLITVPSPSIAFYVPGNVLKKCHESVPVNYRMLSKDEIIEEGDEYWCDEIKCWAPCESLHGVQVDKTRHNNIRRINESKEQATITQLNNLLEEKDKRIKELESCINVALLDIRKKYYDHAKEIELKNARIKELEESPEFAKEECSSCGRKTNPSSIESGSCIYCIAEELKVKLAKYQWVNSDEREPTEKDADKHGNILLKITPNSPYIIMVKWQHYSRGCWWVSIPELHEYHTK